jgi:hypothetical protein
VERRCITGHANASSSDPETEGVFFLKADRGSLLVAVLPLDLSGEKASGTGGMSEGAVRDDGCDGVICDYGVLIWFWKRKETRNMGKWGTRSANCSAEHGLPRLTECI